MIVCVVVFDAAGAGEVGVAGGGVGAADVPESPPEAGSAGDTAPDPGGIRVFGGPGTAAGGVAGVGTGAVGGVGAGTGAVGGAGIGSAGAVGVAGTDVGAVGAVGTGAGGTGDTGTVAAGTVGVGTVAAGGLGTLAAGETGVTAAGTRTRTEGVKPVRLAPPFPGERDASARAPGAAVSSAAAVPMSASCCPSLTRCIHWYFGCRNPGRGLPGVPKHQGGPAGLGSPAGPPPRGVRRSGPGLRPARFRRYCRRR